MTIAQESQTADIPVIDLGILKDQNVSPAAIDRIVDQIRSACANTGFFQIINHGVSMELQQAVFEASKKVFQMPKEEKLALKRDPFGNRGYEVLEGQSLEGAYEGHKKMQAEYSGNDLKEGYYVGKERAPDDPMLQRRFNGVNKWPPGIPEFPPVMSKYYDIMYDLATEIMELIALYRYSQTYLLTFRSLGFEKSFFMDSGFCVDGVAALRLLHYPPQKGGPPRIGAGAHTGSIVSDHF
jgi:isopenicillin N synthase-like dioxygenase